MNAKATKVMLVANGITREFEIEHAERLLRMRNNGGWKLPEESKYELSHNGIKHRRNKRADITAEEQESDN